MLPETTISVPEIMQTEEVGLHEVPILNPLSDTEMTVKEEIQHPVEALQETKKALNECTTTDLHTPLNALDEPCCNFEESVIGHQFNSSFDTIRPIHIPLLQDSTPNVDPHESAASTSTSTSISSSTATPSIHQRIEKEKNRGKRRSRWKLKFHHQALPPEYLDHYEASMAQQEVKATAAKPDSKVKASGSYALKAPVSKQIALEKAEKIVLPSTQCFVKVEQESTKYETKPLGSNSVMDQLHILPIQTLTISDDNESNKVPDDLSILNENATPLVGDKSHFGNERLVPSKGLLGTLLTTSTITSELCSKAVADNERKRKSVIMSPCSGNNNTNSNASISRPLTPSNNNGPSGSKIRSYHDLPYMGEITLDNMKPRRGRKPKKADICHLIYKNYGTTVLPGTPLKSNLLESEDWSQRKCPEAPHNLAPPYSMKKSDMRLKQENLSESSLKCKSLESLKQSPPVSHSDVQNRIISSLLEKRLMTSQEGKKPPYNSPCLVSTSSYLERNDNSPMNNPNSWSENGKPTTSVSDEPLNLCVKDLNQLKIRLLRKHGNFYEPRANDVIKSEPPSPNTSHETDLSEHQSECPTKLHEESERSSNRFYMKMLRSEVDDVCEPFTFPEGECSRASTPSQLLGEPTTSNSSSPLPGGYIYWPSAGVFVHPMALQSQCLYYQKMGAIPLVPISPTEPQSFMPSHLPQVNLIPNMNSSLSYNSVVSPKTASKKDHKPSVNKTLIPKAFSMMMDTSSKPTPSMSSSEVPFSRLKRLAPLGNPPIMTSPTKRKRSAIFIPPMPSENSSNPTTEVSICKFKFTGGAKPSLQEKKMLSVDSGGNFRYYSGTGDKSMRGYEFFPRETLQQSGSVGGTSSEQFLAASTTCNNEKIGSSNLTLGSNENKSVQLHLSGFTEQVANIDSGSSAPNDAENGETSFGSLSYEQQTQSGCVRKKNDNSMKGRNLSVSADSERNILGCKEDEQSPNSQVRMRRKRKTRKSLAREKLEQTFKEKGFLIQTQQLESAEGATYCKFRQLRKFTRYLFRSWKDYLPGNVREMSVAAGVAGPETSPSCDVIPTESEMDGELSCSNSPTPCVQHISESTKTFPST